MGKAKVAKVERSLSELFAECAPSFQKHIRDLAEAHGKTWEQVYGWWRDYSRDCRNYDQSPILAEFEEWYRGKLRG